MIFQVLSSIDKCNLRLVTNIKYTYNCVHGKWPPFHFWLALHFLHFGFRVLHANVVEDFSCKPIKEANPLPLEFDFLVVDLVQD